LRRRSNHGQYSERAGKALELIKDDRTDYSQQGEKHMLKRLYIDNYKCLVNFEYLPGKAQLILGGNGSGKSSVFDVLARLRSFLVDGMATMQLFDAPTLTRWQERNQQTFELDIEVDGGVYHYQLIVEHFIENKISRVCHEEVLYNGLPLFITDEGETQLFRENASQSSKALLDGSRSGLLLLSQRRDNTRLVQFIDWINRLYCLQIDPHQMLSASSQEEADPEQNLANYASWYRHLTQEEPNAIFNLREYLQQLFDDFDSLSLVKEGEHTRILRAEFHGESQKNGIKFDFAELSDGQRALIGLYTLLALAKEKAITLCIDEPDNFIMLAEIAPWLAEMQEQTEAHGSQVLMISHHPELINYYVPRDAVRFFRQQGGPVRVKPFTTAGTDALPPAEIIARGWEDE
jgi:predicted ATPase